MEHSKGPWKAINHPHLKGITVYCRDGMSIASVRPRKHPIEQVANAYAISAVPKLVAACRAIIAGDPAAKELAETAISIVEGRGSV